MQRNRALVLAFLATVAASSAVSRAVTLSEGDLLISDYELPGVIHVDPGTGAQTVVSQGGLFSGGSEFPKGIVARVAAQTIYVGMVSDARVLAVAASDGAQSVAASDPALSNPRALRIGAGGKLLVASGNALLLLDPDDGSVATLSGAPLPGAAALAAEGGDVLVAGFGSHGPSFGNDGYLARVDALGAVTPIVPAGTTLYDPEGVVVSADGRTFLADSGSRAVYEVDLQDGSLIERIPDVDAHALARDPQERLLVLEGFTEIARYDTTSFSREFVVGPGGTFSGAEQFSVVPEAGPLPRALVVLATLAYAARRRAPRRVSHGSISVR